jgi:RNA polymerase sigma-70 factor, ECF subfamily
VTPPDPLLQRLRQDDVAALEELYALHWDLLCRFAARITGSMATAEEVVEDVYVRVWEQRRSLDVRCTLRAYLYGAVRQQALLQHRTESNRERLLQAAAATGATPGTSTPELTPEQHFEAAELAARLARAIDALPERAREAFLLQRQHGLTQSEIADAMEIAVSTVEKHLARAMAELTRVVDEWRADRD